jgi:hypothetical protein
MPNYNESSVSGTKYTRSNKIVIRNDLKQTPAIYFSEEDVFVISETEHIAKPAQGVGTPFTPENAETEFALLHPATGTQIGTAKYQDIYVLLHSLYYHLATQRDIPPVVEPTPEPTPEE